MNTDLAALRERLQESVRNEVWMTLDWDEAKLLLASLAPPRGPTKVWRNDVDGGITLDWRLADSWKKRGWTVEERNAATAERQDQSDASADGQTEPSGVRPLASDPPSAGDGPNPPTAWDLANPDKSGGGVQGGPTLVEEIDRILHEEGYNPPRGVWKDALQRARDEIVRLTELFNDHPAILEDRQRLAALEAQLAGANALGKIRIDELEAQLAAQQPVIEAAREFAKGEGMAYGTDLREAIRTLDAGEKQTERIKNDRKS